MAKRRTKKQKQKAKHNFNIHWDPEIRQSGFEADNKKVEASVKGEKEKSSKKRLKTASAKDNADNTGSMKSLGTIKKDIIRSVTLAGLIIAMELVIYLIL